MPTHLSTNFAMIPTINTAATSTTATTSTTSTTSRRTIANLLNTNNTITDETFVCQTCGLRFCSRRNLKRHFSVKHEPIKLICNKCGLKFSYAHRLRAHLKKHTVGGGIYFLLNFITLFYK